MSAGHIRPRGPGAWELKYDLGRDPITGKRRIRYTTVRGSKRDAQQELRRLLGTVDQGRHIDPGKLTVGAWLAQWLEEARHSTARKTHERYTEIVLKHLVPALGIIPLARLQPVHLQNYYSAALASGRRDGKGGLAPQTVRHHDRVLNVALKRARALRLIATNPVEDVTPPKVEQRELRVLDPAETGRLLATAVSSRLHVPVFLALATGMRRGEVLAIRWQDVDPAGGSLQVVQSLEQTDAGLRFKAPKTARSRRRIALPASAIDLLRAHRVNQLEERMQLGLGRDERGLVFTRIDGEAIAPDGFSKEFRRLARRAGLPEITFHALRHTHITNLLRAGVHPKVAAERAGHSSVSVTMDVYSHVMPGMQEDAAHRIDAALQEALAG